MPKFLEDRLKKEYPGNPHAVYGTLNAIGAMHGNKETAKGREMEKKHEAKMKSSGLREMRIEVHRDPAGKVTGHTIHHEHVAKPSKSGAFSEGSARASFPFGAGQHHEMMAHVGKHLGGMEAPNPQEDDGNE